MDDEYAHAGEADPKVGGSVLARGVVCGSGHHSSLN